jgi:hypothetical protein
MEKLTVILRPHLTVHSRSFSVFYKTGLGVGRKEKALAEIKAAGIRLPVDYALFDRTFDGID